MSVDKRLLITGTTHILNFERLSPDDFERLCLWLVEREGYERLAHLGAAGNEQGRDIVAWRNNERYAFQCKRVRNFYPGNAIDELDKVLALPEAQRPVELIFLVTCDVSAETRQRACDYCSDRMRCTFWALTELDEKVKSHPDIVTEFFQIPSRPVQQPYQVDAEALKAAQHQLDMMPLDTLPQVAPLPPGSRMPFGRNSLFVGRENDLRFLAKALKSGEIATIGQIAATTGLGGIGKTQLASEFAHRYGQFFIGGVFWLSFTDPNTIATQVASLGGPDALNLQSNFGALPFEEQLGMVHAVWQSPMPRLLIFDNCEDETLLMQERPVTGGCRILVTSRRGEWEPALGITVLSLEVLNREESINLLWNFRSDLTRSIANDIADELGDLPLALHLAGSFLAYYQRVIDPAEYLNQLRRPAILDHPSLQGRGARFSPTHHDLHVGRTFAISYDRLQIDHPIDTLALNLLARAAYFAPGEPIPHDLLIATLNLTESDFERLLQAEDALIRLIDLGLFERNEDVLVLHRLLAEFVKTVTDNPEAQVAVEETLLAGFQKINVAGYPLLLLDLQPHLVAVTNAAMMRADERAMNLCNALAQHFYQIGNYTEALTYNERALEICEQVKGGGHPLIASCLNNIGHARKALGDYTGAQGVFERALAVCIASVGEQHEETAACLNSLGGIFQDQGDLIKARGYLERALAIRLKVLGEDNPITANTINNLGFLYRAEGDYVTAWLYYERALNIRKRLLGEYHSDTAQSLNNLGAILDIQGHYAEAQIYYEQALSICEQVLGENHPITATTLNNLGYILQAQGHLHEARVCHERVMTIYEQIFDKKHPYFARCLNNLGHLLKEQGELDKAQSYLEQALAICEQVLGDNHSDTALILNNIGRLLQIRGDFSGAKIYFERALTIWEQLRDEDHPDIALALNNLGSVLSNLGDMEGALHYHERALNINEKRFGENHPHTANSLNNIGFMLQTAGKLKEARIYYERALAIRNKVLGETHPDTALTLDNLGCLLLDQGNLTKAQYYLERALAIREKVLGKTHLDTAVSLHNIGMLLGNQGDWDGAINYLQRAINLLEPQLGPNHPRTQITQKNLEEARLRRQFTTVSMKKTPERQMNRKPNRNAPCWCGSGKKYKHCHLKSDHK